MDYQASTPVDSRVFEAMQPYFSELFGNPHASDHVYGWRAQKAIDSAAERIGRVIGADADEIIFTSGATEANNLAITGLAARNPKRRRILVSAVEHKCVLASAEASRRFGFSVESIPVDKFGYLDLMALERLLADDVLLVSVMAANNEIGTLQPLKPIVEMAHQLGVFVHTDASQLLPAADILVHDLDVDLASFSAHKLYGPKGIGALYVRHDVQRHIEPQIVGGGQQNGLRAGTIPVSLCVGFAEAVSYYENSAAVAEERQRIRRLRDQFYNGIMRLEERCVLNGPLGTDRHPSNLNVQFPGNDARDLIGLFQPRLAATTGSACTTGMTEPSHVLKAIGLTDEEANASIRFSLGRFTTESEVWAALDVIASSLQAANV
jgi:cysteine desulfurase